MAGGGFGIGIMELVIGGVCLLIPIALIAAMAISAGRKGKDP